MFPSDFDSPQYPGWTGTTQKDCERKIEKSLRRNMTVKFMIDKLKEVRLILNFLTSPRRVVRSLGNSSKQRSASKKSVEVFYLDKE